jgi:hypothetical protein
MKVELLETLECQDGYNQGCVRAKRLVDGVEAALRGQR